MRVLRQTRTASNETATPGYTLLGAGFGYREVFRDLTVDVFFRLENLLDEEARNHTSFVKDLAPLPGRHARAGLRLAF
jgi:iron complex outermembrane recepter protein